MITFWIHPYENRGYEWKAVVGNSTRPFRDARDFTRREGYPTLRSCVESLRKITRHLRDDSWDIRLTIAADDRRRETGESAWGLARTVPGWPRRNITSCKAEMLPPSRRKHS